MTLNKWGTLCVFTELFYARMFIRKTNYLETVGIMRVTDCWMDDAQVEPQSWSRLAMVELSLYVWEFFIYFLFPGNDSWKFHLRDNGVVLRQQTAEQGMKGLTAMCAPEGADPRSGTSAGVRASSAAAAAVGKWWHFWSRSCAFCQMYSGARLPLGEQ